MRRDQSHEELRDEDSEAIAGLVPVEGVGTRELPRSFVFTLRFPAQDYKLGEGDAVVQ